MIILARVVRKVSNKNLANANKNKKVNKWVIGGIIAGLVIAIAVAVILWVTLGGNEESNKVDYFETYTFAETEKTVEFTKANYNGVLNILDENYVGYVDEGTTIVFAYNSNTFDPENNKDHNKLLEYIADVQLKVDEAKAKGIKVELYIVDITISDSDWAIMGDPTFGGATSVTGENLASVQPLLAYIDNAADEKLNKKCSKYTTSTILSTAVPSIIVQLEEKIASVTE
jgi:hypothetical protein